MKCITVYQYRNNCLLIAKIISHEEALDRLKKSLTWWHLSHVFHTVELTIKTVCNSTINVHRCINCNEKMIVLSTRKGVINDCAS